MKKLSSYLLIGLLFSFSVNLFSQSELKIISYNIRLDLASDGENRWDLRKDKVAGLINYYEPDFAGMQEVLHTQLVYLQKELKDYEMIGVGRDDGKEGGEYSCIFYKKDKYKLIKQGTFWLSPTPDIPSRGWDAAFNRVCTYGLFELKKGKKKVWVFNTHLDHRGETARLESVKLITQKINEMISTEKYPVIISGDFNSKPEEEPAKFMSSSFTDSRTASELIPYGPADTWNAFQFDKKPDGRIDYIFINDKSKIQIKKFATITDSYDKKYPSDHFPVMATLELLK